MMEQSGVSFVIIIAESKQWQEEFTETFIYFSGSVTFHTNTTLQTDLINHIWKIFFVCLPKEMQLTKLIFTYVSLPYYKYNIYFFIPYHGAITYEIAIKEISILMS